MTETGSMPSSSPMKGGPRTSALSTAIAIGVAVTVASTLVFGSYLSNGSDLGFPAPPADWTMFRVAETTVQSDVAPAISGPWQLVYAEGAAANGPWAPMQWQWGISSFGVTCGLGPEDLLGISTLTFWNASAYPSSDSPNAFTSGGAPLWTFVFENASGSRIVATWFTGEVILNGVVGANSTCPGTPVQPILPSVEMDSNAAGQAALGQGRAALIASGGYHAVLYFPGPTLLPFGTTAGGTQPPWQVVFTGCGQPTFLGASNITDFVLNSSTGMWYDTASANQECYNTYYLINLNTSVPRNTTSPAGMYVATSVSNISAHTSAVPPVATASDLTTNLFDPDVSILGGSGYIRSATAVCNNTTLNFTNCTPPATGWYAVLFAANGSWLDSFPSAPNGRNWTVGGVPVAAGDELGFVFAAGPVVNANIELRGTLSSPWVWANVRGPAIYF